MEELAEHLQRNIFMPIQKVNEMSAETGQPKEAAMVAIVLWRRGSESISGSSRVPPGKI